MKTNIAKRLNIILYFSILVLNTFGQSDEKEKNFIYFIREIANIEKIKPILFSYQYQNIDNVLFVQTVKEYISENKQIKIDLADKIIYLWPHEIIFFNKVDYWLQIKNCHIADHVAMFEVRTYSVVKLSGIKYLRGVIVFKKDEQDNWYIEKNNIKKVDYSDLYPLPNLYCY